VNAAPINATDPVGLAATEVSQKVCELPASGTTKTIILWFENCCIQKKIAVVQSMCALLKALDSASRDKMIYGNYQDTGRPGDKSFVETLKADLDRFFGEPLDAANSTLAPWGFNNNRNAAKVEPISESSVDAVFSNLRQLEDAFDEPIGFQCEETGGYCDGLTPAYVYQGWRERIFGTDIHLCPRFFKKEGAEQAAILSHEMMHEYLNWFWHKGERPSIGGQVPLGIPYYMGEESGDPGFISSEDLLINPPTYEMFLQDRYLSGKNLNVPHFWDP